MTATVNAATPVLSSGSETAYSTDGGTTYVVIPQVLDAGQWGEEAAFIDTTPEDAVAEEGIADLPAGSEIQLSANDVPGNTDQQAFVALAQARAIVLMRRTLSSGRTIEAKVQWLGFFTDPAAKGAQGKWSAKGKVVEGVTWGTVG